MVADVTELARLQAWMQAVLMHSDEGDRTYDEMFRRPVLLEPEKALAIYREGYVKRVVGSVATMHPALRHSLGDRKFEVAVLDCLRRHPPRGHKLTELDRDLADSFTSGFLTDLARLERMVFQLRHGPGGDDGIPVVLRNDCSTREALLEPASGLRLFRSSFPVGAYFTAVKAGDRPAPPSPAQSFLVLLRRDFAVTLLELDNPRYAVLDAIVGGARIGDAVRVAGSKPAWSWVAQWAGDRFFRALRLPG